MPCLALNAIIHQRYSSSHALAPTRNLTYTTICRPLDAPIPSCHSMHAWMPYLPDVSNSLSLIQKIYMSISPCIHAYRCVSHWTGLLVWDIALSVCYVSSSLMSHNTCDTRCFLRWILTRSYMSSQWFFHCHRLVAVIISCCIILLMKCWLWLWGIMDNWHVYDFRYWDTYHPQLVSNGMQCIQYNFHGNRLYTKHWIGDCSLEYQ